MQGNGALIGLVVAMAVPVAAGWLLAPRLGRLRAALFVALAGGLLAWAILGVKAACLCFSAWLGLAALGGAPYFVPSRLKDAAESLKKLGRHG